MIVRKAIRLLMNIMEGQFARQAVLGHQIGVTLAPVRSGRVFW